MTKTNIIKTTAKILTFFFLLNAEQNIAHAKTITLENLSPTKEKNGPQITLENISNKDPQFKDIKKLVKNKKITPVLIDDYTKNINNIAYDIQDIQFNSFSKNAEREIILYFSGWEHLSGLNTSIDLPVSMTVSFWIKNSGEKTQEVILDIIDTKLPEKDQNTYLLLKISNLF